MTSSQPNDIFQPGEVLNNTYRIEELLGRGGTSEVYKACSEISGKVIAVKALKSEFALNEDFLLLMTREEDVREIRHDAVVRYFDMQRMPDGVVYLVMDYVDGPGLDKKLNDGGMSANDLMIVAQRICEGLVAAHGRNIVHRDLSPDNIILRNDVPAEAVIIDFGIAKDTNPGAETIVGNEFAGKYAYAAPEQLGGNTDVRSDIYSLGALLLSTFRGEKPDIGNNPMEVVQKKSQPLNLDGVPMPLGKLIARMSDPIPANRFSSATELLAAIKNPDEVIPASSGTIALDLDDATVIAPVKARQNIETVSKVSAAPLPIGIPETATKARAKLPEAKRRGGMLPILIGVLMVGGVTSAYFGGLLDGVLGVSYPVADPYALIIEKSANGPAQAVGNVPSPEVQSELAQQLEGIDGSTDLELASGDISEDWGRGIVDITEAALKLDEFRIAVQGNRARIVGLAKNRKEQSTVQADLASGVAGSFIITADIGIGPRFLQPETLSPTLTANADCGPLHLVSPPQIGYGLEDQIVVRGRFASEATRADLLAKLSEIAGDRPIQAEGEVLNESLCQINAVLPKAGPGGFDIRLGYGSSGTVNQSGHYVVGDNPTIHVNLPSEIEKGFLWVSVIDVKGVVFHLLPNRLRPDNKISSLRNEADADGYVQLAYALEEANGRIAFNVDGSVLGKSKILAIYSEELLFPDLRPTTESVASYADALQAARNSGAFKVGSLDATILTTEQ